MVWLIVAGLLSGVLAGMGMGGGTVYIPILTQVFRVPQHLAQWLNLVAFVPMAVVSLTVHAHNGLLDKRGFVTLVIPSAASAIGFSLLAVHMHAKILSLLFGILLVGMGLVGVVATAVNWVKTLKANTPKEPDDPR